jgi:tRNA dimethylallyltransferase
MSADSPFNFASDAWFLSGPTAAGKTRVGLELAEILDAEIVSLDSMAIYREMDIGTAKPTAEEQVRGRHHLIDIVSPADEYSLAEYMDDARDVCLAIRERGKRALFVGGTPLYLKALLRGVDTGPPPDWEFREQVAAEVAEVGVEALHARLAQVDPLAAAKLHPHDQRRIIRALEVYKATRQPLSHRQTHFERGKPAGQRRVFVLHWPRTALHRRIEARVERMFDIGLVDEARGLLQRHPQLSRTALQAVGYRESFSLLRGETTLLDTIEQVKIRTRRFARRQETWFRSLSECRVVTLDEEMAPRAIAEQIAANG